METSFSSPRNESFPAGLRVLVVDDDPTWLKILEKMLKKCSYEVTTCGLARDALYLLRERKDGYDIVISDVNMPDMDGFKLLEHVGLEMDLPVIMMSVDGETSRVMKGVQHGACDYLLKPIRMKELRNIWQHVFRKKIHEIRDIEGHESIDGIQLSRNGSDLYEDGYFLDLDDLTSSRKRKDIENKYDDKDLGDSSSTKKARVVWSVDLHQKFVKAVHQIGFDKVGPKKILDLMNVPWLTRENVASHLQKYRLYLSRLQKENDLKSSFGGVKHSDYPPRDPQGMFGLQNSISSQHSDVTNDSYRFSGNNFVAPTVVDQKSLEDDVKRTIPEPIAESKRGLTRSVHDSHMTRSSLVDLSHSYEETKKGLIADSRSSQMAVNHSFASVESEINFTMPTKFSWIETQMKQEHKPADQPAVQIDSGFNKPQPAGVQNHLQADLLQPIPSISSRPSILDGETTHPIKKKLSQAAYRTGHIRHVSPTITAADSFSDQTKSCVVDEGFDPISSSLSNMKNQGFNLSCLTNFEPGQKNLFLGSGSSFASLDDELQISFYPGDYFGMNLGVPEYNDPEVPAQLYEGLRFGCEYPCESSEYTVADQGLFIA